MQKAILERLKANLREKIGILNFLHYSLNEVLLTVFDSKNTMSESEQVEYLISEFHSMMEDLEYNELFGKDEEIEELHDLLSRMTQENQYDRMMDTIEKLNYYLIDFTNYLQDKEEELEGIPCE